MQIILECWNKHEADQKKQMEDFLEVHIPKQSASHMHLLKRVRKRD